MALLLDGASSFFGLGRDLYISEEQKDSWKYLLVIFRLSSFSWAGSPLAENLWGVANHHLLFSLSINHWKSFNGTNL